MLSFAASPGAGSWSIVNSPNSLLSRTPNLLSSTTCLSASDCWAVGYYFNGNTYQTLAEHWDGTSWSIVSSPNANTTQSNQLYGLSCGSASDCWAVGSYFAESGGIQTLIEHWDGISWAIANSPNTAEGNVLTGVTCVSASDCWAVGYSGVGGAIQTLTERWDGSSWAIVSSPNALGGQGNYLSSVTCLSGLDCWAVGNYVTTIGYASVNQTLIERWNGTSWAIVSSPNTAGANVLYGVACMSASICWAVGYSAAGGNAYQTLIESWDGTSWTILSSPNSSAAQPNVLYNVTCASASGCWAVGAYYTGNDVQIGVYQTLIERWNGTSWTIATSPNANTTQSNLLTGVTCVSASDCSVVGYYYNGSAYQTLIERWNGTSWTIVSSPNINIPQGNYLYGVTCLSASDCWSVGFYSNGTAYQTLIERWNGTSWTTVSSPNTNVAQNNELFSVSCASDSDCWATGYYVMTDPVTGATTSQTLIERWDGATWAIASSPNTTAAVTGAMQTNRLSSVTCVSASDCWAVGYYSVCDPVTDCTAQTLIERWNGTSWAIVTSPNVSTTEDSILRGVTCASASNCWAVGYSVGTTYQTTLVEHWDGTSWAIVSSPNSSNTQHNLLFGVTCASATNCWAIGIYYNGSAYQTLIERWDGTSWAIVTSPNTSATTYNELFSVTCGSSSNCWAVGYYIAGSAYQTLILGWDGASWSVVNSPNTISTQDNVLTAVTCISVSDCSAVGYYGGGETLVLRHTPNTPPTPTSVVSRKTHGSSGPFDIDLLLSGSPGIECRSGGPNGNHTMVFTFANVLNAVAGVTAAATTSSGTVPVTVLDTSGIGTDTHQYILNLSGVPNASHLNVTLNGVTDSANNVGDVSANMDVLLGDVNATGRTDSGDVTAVRNKTMSIPDEQTFHFDVNISGRIDSGDVTVTRNATVTVLP
jgi:hypothetical protein